MIEAGKVLQDRYRIKKQIGQGGMGAVYVAVDERFGSTVAIKETLCTGESYRKATEREARLLNSLKHSALPRVSDHFLEENGQFLVMEYIPGEDLHAMIEQNGKPFPVEDVILWADQLLDALEFLHNQATPVIHRDIKPQNLKLTSRGQIILLDFGLAKGNPSDAGYHTAASSIFGYSRNYASLEQIQGTGTDPRSDLYSLAATLYHLITGVQPEDALTRAMNVLSGGADPQVPASVVRPEVPNGVAAILAAAMDLNANLRPKSASKMRSMLRQHEEYVLPPAALTDTRTTAQPEIFNQETQAMPGVTQRGERWSTDVKTEVLPVGDAAATAAAALYSIPEARHKPRKGLIFRLAIAALSVLLVAGGVGVGVSLFGDGGSFGASDIADPDPQPAVMADIPAIAPLKDGVDAPVADPKALTVKPSVENTAGSVSATGKSATKSKKDPPVAIADPKHREHRDAIVNDETVNSENSELGGEDLINVETRPDNRRVRLPRPPPGLTPTQLRKWRTKMLRLKRIQTPSPPNSKP
ncbi:MAG: serine/threonine-protein kinase [Pyrinomonadaceae bacterium]